MNQPDSVSSEPTPSRGAKIKQIALLLLLGLVALAVAYGVGRLQTSARIDAAEQRARAESERATNEQGKVLQLEARRQLHLASLSLDERNFGVAQRQLEAAAKLLGENAASPPLLQLSKLIGSYQLRATEDLAGARQQLLQWMRKIDQVLPPP